MERRTFLKGIIGAAASAFLEIKFPKEVLAEAAKERPLVTCQKDGEYWLTADCILAGESARYDIEILAGGECLGRSVIMRNSEDFLHQASVVVIGRLRGGSDRKVRVLKNGVPDNSSALEVILAVHEIGESENTNCLISHQR